MASMQHRYHFGGDITSEGSPLESCLLMHCDSVHLCTLQKRWTQGTFNPRIFDAATATGLSAAARAHPAATN